jgi:hypothetical protein
MRRLQGRGGEEVMMQFHRVPGPAAERFTFAIQVLLLVVLAAAPELALAQATMPGQQLLLFARTYIIAPIALFAIVITGVAAFIRPDLIKSTGYIAIIAVVLFFLLSNADRLLQVLRAG